jgi:anti-sigma B factor antagonist
MEITIIPENDVQYIEIHGRVDAINSGEVQDKLMKLTNDGYKKLLVCMEHVDYISSSGLRSFLSVGKSVGKEGFLKFCCMQPTVKEVFTITGFNSIFKIYDSKAEALD